MQVAHPGGLIADAYARPVQRRGYICASSADLQATPVARSPLSHLPNGRYAAREAFRFAEIDHRNRSFNLRLSRAHRPVQAANRD